MKTRPKILLTGAGGNTGAVIAQELLKRNIPFVVMTHSDSNKAKFQQQGMDVVYGNFDIPETLELALTGIERAYLVCTPDEKLVRRETAFIAAAKKAGVRYLVMCSAFASGEDAESENLRSHGVIEKAVRESGMDYTIIRPVGFMQTFTLFVWDMIQKADAMSMAAGDGGMALIDVRDVAAVGLKALTETGHEGKVYDLTGPENLTMYDQAEILSKVLGRKIYYIPSSEEQMDQIMKVLGVPATPAEHVQKVFKMQREHRIEMVLPTLQQLGIQPTHYEQFVRDYVAGRTQGGNSFPAPDTLFIRLFNAFGVLMVRMQVSQLKRKEARAAG